MQTQRDKGYYPRLDQNENEALKSLKRVSEFDLYTDQELWNEFKSGKKAAFIYIYNKYFDRLYAYGHRFTSDSELIKDCIQEVFIVINLTKTKLSDTDCIHLYLYKALRTTILKSFKIKQRQVASLNNGLFVPFNFDISIEEKIINRQLDEERVDKLKVAIKNLTEREREIIFYYYYENFSLDQIRQVMGFKSSKIAQNLIYKAIRGLREIMLIFLFTLLAL